MSYILGFIIALAAQVIFELSKPLIERATEKIYQISFLNRTIHLHN